MAIAQRTTLTERQVDVLRWIADGCADGVMTDDAHKITAAALRNRGLVKTSGRGPTWTAKTTDAGRDYLAQVDGPNPPLPRQGNRSVTAHLVADVIAAGGSLRVPRPSGYPRSGDVNYAQRAQAAERNLSLALALGLAASRLEGNSTDPEVAAVAAELTRLSGLMRDRLRVSGHDDHSGGESE